MRDYIFRGKCKDSGEWTEGYCIRARSWSTNAPAWLICTESILTPELRIGHALEVIPETIGRYTGLNDRDGRWIYDGDIVRCEFANAFGECFETDVIVNLDDHELMYDMEHSSFLEIVGNIHDNKKEEP